MKELALAFLLPLALAAPSVLSSGAALAQDTMTPDRTAIRELWKTYSSARVAGDATLWLSLYDEDGIQMPPGVPARGKDVLKTIIPKAFAAGTVKAMTIHPAEVTVAGDWAYSRGTYDSEQVVNGNTVQVDGKFLTILKRAPDGSWKIYRDCFNSNSQ